MQNYILYSIPGKTDQLNKIIFIYSIMDYKYGVGPKNEGKRPELPPPPPPPPAAIEPIIPAGQVRENELRPDQLEIGKEYRVEYYGISATGKPNTRRYACIARYEKNKDIFMIFRITNPGDYVENPNYSVGKLEILMETNSRHNFYWKFFLTARDIEERSNQRASQKALRIKFGEKMDPPKDPSATMPEVSQMRLDPASIYGLTDGFLAPNPKPVKEPGKKLGGKKYKTRQTKPRRKNRTRRRVFPKSRRRNSIASGRRRITRAN